MYGPREMRSVIKKVSSVFSFYIFNTTGCHMCRQIVKLAVMMILSLVNLACSFIDL